MDINDCRKQLKRFRKKLIANILELVTPYMWESGFIESNFGGSPKVYTKLFILEKEIKLNFSQDTVLGFTTKSIITDFYVGMVTCPYEAIAIEDLLTIYKYLVNKDIQKLTKKSCLVT